MPTPDSKPVRLWIRVTPKVATKLGRHAEHQGVSRARLMREIVESWLDESPDEPEGDPIVRDRKYDQSAYMQQRRIERRKLVDAQDVALRVQWILNALKGQVVEVAETIDEAIDHAAQEKRNATSD